LRSRLIAAILIFGIATNISAALGPQPEPPDITGMGLFSGEIVSVALRPQPEPPIYNLGMNTAGGLFSGETMQLHSFKAEWIVTLPPAYTARVVAKPV